MTVGGFGFPTLVSLRTRDLCGLLMVGPPLVWATSVLHRRSSGTDVMPCAATPTARARRRESPDASKNLETNIPQKIEGYAQHERQRRRLGRGRPKARDASARLCAEPFTALAGRAWCGGRAWHASQLLTLNAFRMHSAEPSRTCPSAGYACPSAGYACPCAGYTRRSTRACARR